MRSHFLKPMVVVATFSLVACNQDQDPPTSTDAGADMFGNDVVATPDVPIAKDVHATDDGQGADEPDVTADIPIDNRPEDAPVDRRAPTRPDGGSFSCGYQGTLEHLVFTATLPTGALDRCDSVSLSVHRTVSGVLRSVTSSAADTYAVTIDTCTGDACAAQNVVLDILSTTPLSLPVGAFVEADYWMVPSHTCSYFLRFSNLPEFNGQKNPISDSSKLYFIFSDGFFNSSAQLAPVGVGLSLSRLWCPREGNFPDPPQHPVDTYVYQFSHNGNDLLLAVGESATFTVNGQSVLVKNLRSYQPAAYDDYWNWTYTLLGQ
ncbi:MAG TPA: hypothetical protein VK540_00015 [Polyangiaceae bacterium]|nr:hypothetical protein [Polyangiaceae bacterium]